MKWRLRVGSLFKGGKINRDDRAGQNISYGE